MYLYLVALFATRTLCAVRWMWLLISPQPRVGGRCISRMRAYVSCECDCECECVSLGESLWQAEQLVQSSKAVPVTLASYIFAFAFVLWHFALITITKTAIARRPAKAIPAATRQPATFKRCFHFARSDSK